MKAISIILIILGILGLLLSLLMFGDIAIAGAIGSITAILSGIGFMQVDKKLNSIDK